MDSDCGARQLSNYNPVTATVILSEIFSEVDWNWCYSNVNSHINNMEQIIVASTRSAARRNMCGPDRRLKQTCVLAKRKKINVFLIMIKRKEDILSFIT